MTLADRAAVFAAEDGALAECHPPFPESFAWPTQLRSFIGQALGEPSPPEPAVGAGGPLAIADSASGPASAGTGETGGGPSPREITRLIAVHAQAPRAVGVFLVRLGGYAAGVFTGYPPALADAKVGSRLVHGRSAAGGWSQQRFARRREKQANEALDAAADTAAAVFGRWESGITASSAPARGRRLDAVVLGGDKRAMAELRGDPRLAPYLALATARFLAVPDPKRAVLEGTPKLFTAVRIRLTEP